ncbi:MAG: alanine racemase [Chitinivibrionia bacterium]|nr:alanine racemase [Chitinivibrionia bacterium]
MNEMEVDLDRIKKNLLEICKRARKNVEQVIAVVKDNSYGLGAKVVSKTLQDAGVVWFAVARVDEAVFLRENGITGDILVLGNTGENFFNIAAQYKITLSLVDYTQISVIKRNYGTYNLRWHLNVDTGMRRDGIMCEDLFSDSKILQSIKELIPVISGVYTHYHSSDNENRNSVFLQQNKFKNAISVLRHAGFNFNTIHSSNSGACVYSTVAENEFIRPGILLYGCRPDPLRDPEIKVGEAVKIISKISGIREIKKGEGVSYGHIWTAPRDTKIATVSIGYADGFPRAITKTAFVEIKGEKYPIVGRVTMDYIMVDIGNKTHICVGDDVYIIGIDELAINAKTIGYELLCKFGGLMNHKYISGKQVISTQKRELF